MCFKLRSWYIIFKGNLPTHPQPKTSLDCKKSNKKLVDGTITFNTILKQFTRIDGKTETGYRYPITQAETKPLHLMNWLQEHNIHGRYCKLTCEFALLFTLILYMVFI